MALLVACSHHTRPSKYVDNRLKPTNSETSSALFDETTSNISKQNYGRRVETAIAALPSVVEVLSAPSVAEVLAEVAAPRFQHPAFLPLMAQSSHGFPTTAKPFKQVLMHGMRRFSAQLRNTTSSICVIWFSQPIQTLKASLIQARCSRSTSGALITASNLTNFIEASEPSSQKHLSTYRTFEYGKGHLRTYYS